MVEAAVELAAGGMVGTPDYMSPEQCAGNKDLGPASDQYSLGIVAYEMLTGCTPFQAETPAALIRMHLSDPVPPPRSLRPDLPVSVQAAILKALAKEPGDRWPTCNHIAGALSRAFF
jgi:serine/threonine-protein kinase